MSRLFFTLFVVLAVFSIAALSEERKRCPRNEVWSECGGRCQATCQNQNPICPLICEPGCVCRKGLIRSSPKGRCIQKCKCNHVN
ncbi:PREDICTED: allergen Api m 6-like [Dufourea novaeangliae]|uniref:Serine protease inhibitor 1 n=1 Tax=Dufourea novaeangliae TaxID=178035 RepID=A0A154PKF3_DUFNO|nr:PREDICTED: allergen Api m 6-like [Dufourea novaeangliae]KZC12325.1 Serine protease inhibitor 1 [Dufourea novaeangliae]